jgi:hypothetical protein
VWLDEVRDWRGARPKPTRDASPQRQALRCSLSASASW